MGVSDDFRRRRIWALIMAFDARSDAASRPCSVRSRLCRVGAADTALTRDVAGQARRRPPTTAKA